MMKSEFFSGNKISAAAVLLMRLMKPAAAALADAVYDPTMQPDPPDTAGDFSSVVIFVTAAILIRIVQLVAKGILLHRYNGKGWMIIIPFYGRYLEYKYYWRGVYYWVSLGLSVLMIGILATLGNLVNGSAGDALAILFLALSLLLLINIVRMRMHMMQTFGFNKWIGLLEALGFGFVMDLICCVFSRVEGPAVKKTPVDDHVLQEHIDNWE